MKIKVNYKLYVAYSHDIYELPIAVADTPTELAKMLGISRNCISSYLTHNRPWIKKLTWEEIEEI